jgi:hypothetical protein
VVPEGGGMSTAELLIPGMEPGVYRDMPMADYLALPHMSASGLEKLDRSPLQYRHALTEPEKRTDALDTGTALHMAVLEPLLFRAHYVVAEPCMAVLGSGNRKGERCGAGASYLHRVDGWLCGKHIGGKTAGLDDAIEILPADTYAAVTGMRDAIMEHPRARTLFQGKGEFETTIVFDDSVSGVRCKVRPDRLVARAGMNVDIKTTRDASVHAFTRQAENLGYFRKLALYRRALRAIGWPYTDTAVVAVESKAPHDLICYLLDEKSLDSADHEIDRLLALYVECMKSGEWPGYATEFQTLERPAWATRESED